MTFHEEPVTFACAGESLVGVLALPGHGDTAANEMPASETAVLIVVGGPQYRAGSHRQFVLVSRAMAQAGYPTLRFDYRGMGDSSGELRDFEAAGEDIAAAADALVRCRPRVAKIVLWGLCDGASAAMMYTRQHQDDRIAGLCLLNPWTRSESTLARTRVKHYYLQRLMQGEFWVKLVRGGVAGHAVQELLGNLRKARQSPSPSTNLRRVAASPQADYRGLMAQAAVAFPGPMLFVLAGEDYTAKEFLESAARDKRWKRCFNRSNVTRQDLAQADHTFTGTAASTALNTVCVDWLQRHWPVSAPLGPRATDRRTA